MPSINAAFKSRINVDDDDAMPRAKDMSPMRSIFSALIGRRAHDDVLLLLLAADILS